MNKIGTWLLSGMVVFGTAGTALAKGPKPKPPTPAVEPAPAPAPAPAPTPVRPWAANVPQNEQEQAIALATRGDEFFATNDYPEAVKYYDEALTHWNHPAIHFNKTVCLMRLNRQLEANTHLAAALEYDGAALSPNDLKNAETFKALLNGSLVKVQITTSQDGVEVTLDGKAIISGAGVGELTTTAGSHALVATKPGFETLTKNLSLNPGEPYSESLLLKPQPKPPTKLVRRWEKTWVPWVVAGSGAATALVGLGAMFVARTNMDSFNTTISNKCSGGCDPTMIATDPDLIDAYDRKDSAELQNAIGIGLVGVGGAAVLTGLVMVALNQPKEVALNAPTVVFNGSDTDFGVSLMGRF